MCDKQVDFFWHNYLTIPGVIRLIEDSHRAGEDRGAENKERYLHENLFFLKNKLFSPEYVQVGLLAFSNIYIKVLKEREKKTKLADKYSTPDKKSAISKKGFGI